MSSVAFIYALCEPGTGVIRYIGKANDPKVRFGYHIRSSIKFRSHLGSWLRSLAGRRPTLLVLKEVDQASWAEEERRFIKAAKAIGIDLVNGTDGGEGVVPTDATRRKMGEWQKGKTKSAEHREKIRATLIGRKRPFTSVQARRNISAALLGKKKAPAAIENMRQAQLRRNRLKLIPVST